MFRFSYAYLCASVAMAASDNECHMSRGTSANTLQTIWRTEISVEEFFAEGSHYHNYDVKLLETKRSGNYSHVYICNTATF